MKGILNLSKSVFILAASLLVYSIGSVAYHRFITGPELFTLVKQDGVYILDLGNVIEEINPDYIALADKIEHLSSSDKMIIKLHNYGGNVSTASLLTNAIKASKATIVADVVGTTYSSGTAIACATSDVNIRPNAFLMQHPVQEVKGNVISPTGRLGLIQYQARSMVDCKNHGIFNDMDIVAVVKGMEVYAFQEIVAGKKVFHSTISPVPGQLVVSGGSSTTGQAGTNNKGSAGFIAK